MPAALEKSKFGHDWHACALLLKDDRSVHHTAVALQAQQSKRQACIASVPHTTAARGLFRRQSGALWTDSLAARTQPMPTFLANHECTG